MISALRWEDFYQFPPYPGAPEFKAVSSVVFSVFSFSMSDSQLLNFLFFLESQFTNFFLFSHGFGCDRYFLLFLFS